MVSLLFRSLMLLWIHLTVLSWNVVFAADGNWGTWSSWSSCSDTCGTGVRHRFRACNSPPPSKDGKRCEGRRREKSACDASVSCSVNGGWGQWGLWNECSKSCGEGARFRFRECDSPAPANGGRPCEGDVQETEACVSAKECVRDGMWAEWSEWSQCSVTCGGGGSRNRYRSCNNPPPSGGGTPCDGRNRDTKKCKAANRCPVDGEWSNWSEWTECSTTCGPGEMRRMRNCDSPPRQHGGRDCNRAEAGEVQIRSCNASGVHCAVNGGWSEWSNWGECNTADCNVKPILSYSYRERSCNAPFPARGGSMCQGTFLQSGLCQNSVIPVNCPVNGGWSDWSKWNCTAHLAIRDRLCNNPTPSGGGKNCGSETSEIILKEETREKYLEVCKKKPVADEDLEGSGSGDDEFEDTERDESSGFDEDRED